MSKNILIIKLGAFGDVISSMGAVQDIRTHYKNDKIYFLTTPPYKDLANLCPWIDDVITTQRVPLWRIDVLFKLKNDINKLKIDLVIDLQCSSRTNLYYRLFFKNQDWCGLAKGCRYQILKKPYYYNETTQLTRLLSSCSIPEKNCMSPDVSWMAQNVDNILKGEELQGRDFAVLFYGCSARNLEKRWPHYSQLAEELSSLNIEPVLIPGPVEINEADNINATVLYGKNGRCLDFFEAAGVCKQAKFVIGNDTGPTHMSAFLGVWGVALFGSHESNMPYFLINTRFVCLQKDNISDISVKDVIACISNHFL